MNAESVINKTLDEFTKLKVGNNSDWMKNYKKRAHTSYINELNYVTSDLVRLFGTPYHKVSCVHHGFENFSSQNNHNNAYISSFKRPFLLYVGSRNGYKNFNSFLEAVAVSSNLINDFDIFIFGGKKLTLTEQALIKKTWL